MTGTIGTGTIGAGGSALNQRAAPMVVAALIANKADEVGIATCCLNSLHIKLTTIADTSAYSKTLAHLTAADPIEIVIPHSAVSSRLTTALMSAADASGTAFVTVPRRHYNDTNGAARLQELMCDSSNRGDAPSEVANPQRYLACAAASALLARLEQSQRCALIPGTLRVTFVALARHVELDRSALIALQLMSAPRRTPGGTDSAAPTSAVIHRAGHVSSMANAASGAAAAPLTLADVIDSTMTRMGQRLLRANLLQPIAHTPTLHARFDAVDALVTHAAAGTLPLRAALKSVSALDLDHVLAVFARECADVAPMNLMQATVEALMALRRILSAVDEVSKLLNGGETVDGATTAFGPAAAPIRVACELLDSIATAIVAADLPSIVAELDRILDHEMLALAAPNTKGAAKHVQLCFAVKTGISDHLDDARRHYSHSVESLVEHVEALKATHSIPSLRLANDPRRGYHLTLDGRAAKQLDPRVFTHVIIPTTAAAAAARASASGGKATAVTHVLQRLSMDNRGYLEETLALQHEVLAGLADFVRARMGSLHAVSEAVALLDLLLSHAFLVLRGHPAATTSSYRQLHPSNSSAAGYVRPIVEAHGPLHVVDGRPLGLQFREGKALVTGRGVPQTIALDGARCTLAVLTGPNGSGKSTVLRNVAHWVLLAHIGCFVPASHAAVPLLDGILVRFTPDDVSSLSASTFATEMLHLGHVLRTARRRYLVLLDEVGRSTSTTDGASILWAAAERLADIRCPTLIATHFTPLTRLAESVSSVCNVHMGAVPVGRGLAFEYAVLAGPCAVRGYGLALATMVGFPPELVLLAEGFKAVLGAKEASTRGDDNEGDANSAAVLGGTVLPPSEADQGAAIAYASGGNNDGVLEQAVVSDTPAAPPKNQHVFAVMTDSGPATTEEL
jgi:DNA mismatch repair protein MSH4